MRKLNFWAVFAPALALGLWVVPAYAQYDVTVTPDQFVPQTWGTNLTQDTVGAYPGDNASGYYWTSNFGATPSATIKIPLPAGMPSGWHQYDVYEWNPNIHRGSPEGSGQWHVVDIASDGTMNNSPTMPWAGQFGTNHQYLQNPQNAPAGTSGWLQLGPGPQSDSTNDGGSGVWMDPTTGNGAPYLQIHYLGFENTPESFDAIRVVQIDVPEPTSLGLVGVGALGLLSRRRRNRA